MSEQTYLIWLDAFNKLPLLRLIPQVSTNTHLKELISLRKLKLNAVTLV